MIYTFRAQYGSEIYRDIQLEASKSLAELAEAILASFGFYADHGYGFYREACGTSYELQQDIEPRSQNSKSVMDTVIANVFSTSGDAMTFRFDNEKNWQFTVRLQGEGQEDVPGTFPRVVRKVGQAPEQYPFEFQNDSELAA